MARIREQALINQLADEFRSIAGIENAFDFATNPDNLTDAMLPAVAFVPTTFNASLMGHHGVHRNEIEIVAVLFVATRQSSGGKLKYIENRAMPFMSKVRDKFQDDNVTQRLLALGNLTRATEFTGAYGAGGTLLTFNGIEYIGCIFRWTFIEGI